MLTAPQHEHAPSDTPEQAEAEATLVRAQADLAAAREAVEQAEAEVMNLTDSPRGTLFVAAPLGVGRRLIAPVVPDFLADYPEIGIRLRLSDRKVDLTTEGLDLAFFLGQPSDSTLRIRKIADCRRVLCAAPAYIAARGMPHSGADLVGGQHDCLNLRYPDTPQEKEDRLLDYKLPAALAYG